MSVKGLLDGYMHGPPMRDMNPETRQYLLALYGKRARLGKRLFVTGGTGFSAYSAHVRTWEAEEYIDVTTQVALLSGRTVETAALKQAFRRYYFYNSNDLYGKRAEYAR